MTINWTREIKFSTAVLVSTIAFVCLFILPSAASAYTVETPSLTQTTPYYLDGAVSQGSLSGQYDAYNLILHSSDDGGSWTTNMSADDVISAWGQSLTLGQDACGDPSYNGPCSTDPFINGDPATGFSFDSIYYIGSTCAAPTTRQYYFILARGTATRNGPGYINAMSSYTGDYVVLQYYCDSSGNTVIGPLNSTPPPDTTHTQFYSFTPILGTTTPVATSSALSVGVTGYISPADYTSDMQLQLQFGVNPNVVGPIFAANATPYTEFNTPVSAAGAFSTTTVVDASVASAYPVKWSLTKCGFSLFGFCISRSTVITNGGTLLTGLGLGTGEGYTSTSTLQSVRGITSVSVAANGATTTLDTSNINATSTVFASAYGIAGIILNKFPINWVVQYADVLSSLPTLTATTTIPAVTVDYGGLREIQNIPTTTPQNLSFTFFSASTFDTVGQMAGVQLARTLVGYTLWLGLIGFAWRRAKSLFTNAEQ